MAGCNHRCNADRQITHDDTMAKGGKVMIRWTMTVTAQREQFDIPLCQCTMVYFDHMVQSNVDQQNIRLKKCIYACIYSYFNPKTLTSLVICEKEGAANNGKALSLLLTQGS